jgi:phosphate transport system protein
MLRSAIDAFVRQDEGAAARLSMRDIEVDALRDELVSQLITRMSEDSKVVSSALALVFVVQSIERVGDHAKNIAEYVVHVVSGVDSRHARQEPASS